MSDKLIGEPTELAVDESHQVILTDAVESVCIVDLEHEASASRV